MNVDQRALGNLASNTIPWGIETDSVAKTASQTNCPGVRWQSVDQQEFVLTAVIEVLICWRMVLLSASLWSRFSLHLWALPRQCRTTLKHISALAGSGGKSGVCSAAVWCACKVIWKIAYPSVPFAYGVISRLKTNSVCQIKISCGCFAAVGLRD